MSIKVILNLIVLSCAVVGLSSNDKSESQKQAPPNLSGTWKLDKSKGNYVKYSRLKPDADLILVISHVEPEIKVARKSVWRGQEHVQELTYYSDGRGEVSRTFIDNIEGKSKTKWEANRLVSRFSVSLKQGLGSLDVLQEWKVSADGKTLTQIQRIQQTSLPRPSSPDSAIIARILNQMGPSEIKRVFNRIS
jgi:hypothetical protein